MLDETDPEVKDLRRELKKDIARGHSYTDWLKRQLLRVMAERDALLQRYEPHNYVAPPKPKRVNPRTPAVWDAGKFAAVAFDRTNRAIERGEEDDSLEGIAMWVELFDGHYSVDSNSRHPEPVTLVEFFEARTLFMTFVEEHLGDGNG